MAERASVLGKESILSVAEGLGPISHDVAEALAPEIEYRLRDVIQARSVPREQARASARKRESARESARVHRAPLA